jgi:hypothetical protein
MSEEEFVKIHIDLPNHWAIGGESLWAKPLGENQYRIENIPFYAYGLNYFDVVFAMSKSEDTIPEIQTLVSRSGHKTIRLFFPDGTSDDERDRILDEIGLSYEGINSFHFALDIEPNRDFQKIFDHLSTLEERKVIKGFETCEARVEGSFDDIEEENEPNKLS